MKITGPGLPETGVPVYNLDGNPGSGNTVPVNDDGSWKFVWYSANIAGIEKMITARYTIIAADLTSPEKKASATILMKKPEFYVNTLSSANPGDSVELSGSAEQGVTYVKIAITDSENRVLHTYLSPVSGSGSFNYGFRVDFGPGQYTVAVSNPSLENALTRVFTVTLPETPVPSLATTGVTRTPSVTVPALTVSPADQTVVPGTSLTPRLPRSVFTPLAGIVISGLIIFRMSTRYRKKKFLRSSALKKGNTDTFSACNHNLFRYSGLTIIAHPEDIFEEIFFYRSYAGCPGIPSQGRGDH